MVACYNRLETVALKIIDKTKPEDLNIQNKYQNTALNYACNNKLERVALTIIGKQQDKIFVFNNEEECGICLEEMQKTFVIKTECGHVFHLNCLGESCNYNYKKPCPLCRANISKDCELCNNETIVKYFNERKNSLEKQSIERKQMGMEDKQTKKSKSKSIINETTNI